MRYALMSLLFRSYEPITRHRPIDGLVENQGLSYEKFMD
jgi:hypothetical protein